jgi:hypothetical protein
MRGNTKINKTLEINRMFPKVLNVFAVKNNIPGIQKGRITKHSYYMQDLMYNITNFRDKNKDKSISRLEATKDIEYDLKYSSNKAKACLKRIQQSSEIKDKWGGDLATQAHHIFLESEYPEFASYLENLILLTPDQHNIKAHPQNNNSLIDPIYQKSCILAKIATIRKSLQKGETYYSVNKLITLLNSTLKLSIPENASLCDVEEEILTLTFC